MAYGISVETSSGTANLADLPVVRKIGSKQIEFSGTITGGTEAFSTAGNGDFDNGKPYTVFAVGGYVSGTKGTSFQMACFPNITTRTGALPADINVTYRVSRQSNSGSLRVQIDLYMLQE